MTLSLDMGFLSEGDYEIVYNFWHTSDTAILDVPSNQRNFSDYDFTLGMSYDYSFVFDSDYSSPFEPGLTFGFNMDYFIPELLHIPIDDGTIFDLPLDMKSIFIDRYNNSNAPLSVVITPEPASIFLFASAFGLLIRRHR